MESSFTSILVLHFSFWARVAENYFSRIRPLHFLMWSQWLPPIWRYAFFMILTNSFRVFSPKQLNLGKSNFGQESDELLFQSQRILLTITKSHFSSRIQNQSKFVDWPAKISLAHKSRRRDRKFVANTRDSNRISKLPRKQLILPLR